MPGAWPNAPPVTAQLEDWTLRFQDFLVWLQVPSTTEFATAGRAALSDGYAAAGSTWKFLFLTLRPVVLLVYWLLYKVIARNFWDYVVVEGIYRHGLSQTKEGLLAFWRFQKSLDRKWLYAEAAGVVCLAALYWLRQWLHRNKYIQRAATWVDHKKRQAAKTYNTTVSRIATISAGLAAMTPHAIFAACAVAVKLFLPRLVTFLAGSSQGSSAKSLLSFWWPLLCTISVLHEGDEGSGRSTAAGQPTTEEVPREQQQQPERTRRRAGDKENSAPSTSTSTPSRKQSLGGRRKTTGTTRRRTTERYSSASRQTLGSPGFFPRTSPQRIQNGGSSSSTDPNSQRRRRRRRSFMGTPLRVIGDTPLDQQEADWLRFWMVRGGLEAVKVLTAWVVPSYFGRFLQELEFAFYLWVYILPCLQPESIGGQKLPEARPLHVITSFLKPATEYLTEQVSSAISEPFWQTYVVNYVSTILDALVLVRLLTRPAADWLLHWAEEGRALVLPAVTIFMPITSIGIVYVQYALSIAKSAALAPRSNRGTHRRLWLRYWVLNALLSAVLYRIPSLVWWLPFTRQFVFGLWCYLSLPKSIDQCYAFFLSELRMFGILPVVDDNEGSQDWQSTRTVQFASWVVDLLPRAESEDADNNGGSSSTGGDGEQSSSDDGLASNDQSERESSGDPLGNAEESDDDDNNDEDYVDKDSELLEPALVGTAIHQRSTRSATRT